MQRSTDNFKRARKRQTSLVICVVFAALGTLRSEPETGLDGVVITSPSKPGPTIQGESDWAPVSDVAFVVEQRDRAVATFITDRQGRFKVSLPPGRYTVKMKNGKPKIGGCGPYEVQVLAGQITQLRWECDHQLRLCAPAERYGPRYRRRRI